MTDEQIDSMVRDADPYRPSYARDLGGAEQALLTEIMAGRRSPRRFAVAVAAAAAVTGVLAATALIGHHPAGRPATPPAQSSPATPTATAQRKAPDQKVPDQKMPGQDARLLIGEPGWKATEAYGFAGASGTIRFKNGPLEVEMDWYPGDQYDRYYADRLEVAHASPVTVDGWPGSVFSSGPDRFGVMLRPRDGVFVEFSTASDGWTTAAFDRVRAHIRRAGASAWLAALPPEIVTPARADEAAAKVLAGVPLPPGFDTGAFGTLGVNDPYHFGAGVTGRVGCAWIAEWIRAHGAGDRTAQAGAAAALRGSHRWTVLKRIAGQGGWSSVFWDVADRTAASGPPAGYRDTLGCR